MSNIKGLLERWSQLEPQLCDKAESCFVIRTSGNYELIPLNHLFDKHIAWIQWAVQQAIIEKGWQFTISNNPLLGSHFVVSIESEQTARGDNSAEALLTTYLKTLEANR